MDTFLNHPLKIGSLTLNNRVIYSPLAGCSDFPFRKIAARYHPGLMFCEMVKMEPLTRGHEVTMRMLDYSEEMRPIGGQICGAKVELAALSARIIEDLGFDCVDLNCGCPVDKVTKDGSGSGLLKNPEKIGEIISEMKAAVSIPVTVKIRSGWDEGSINAAVVTKIAEEAGADAVFVHGRTRKQGYTGPAIWSRIKAAVDAADQMPVIGNGDIFSPEAAVDIIDQTGCTGVLVSRGIMGHPWLVEDILRHIEGREPIMRTFDESVDTFLDHFDLSAEYKDERGALNDMRRVSSWYLKNAPGVRELRMAAAHARSLVEIRQLIEAFKTC